MKTFEEENEVARLYTWKISKINIFPNGSNQRFHVPNKHVEILTMMLVLFLPPSSQTTLYHSMYAFGNHIHVGSVEGTLTTVNCDVSATFSQHCRSNVCNKYLKAANLEYVGWVEVILVVDYARYGLIVLCCIVIG